MSILTATPALLVKSGSVIELPRITAGAPGMRLVVKSVEVGNGAAIVNTAEGVTLIQQAPLMVRTNY